MEKWDACVNRSPHGSLYGISWFLSAVSPHWSGIVVDDYHAVFPFFRSRKYGLPLLLHPPFYQKSSVFSDDNIDGFAAGVFKALPFSVVKYYGITAHTAYASGLDISKLIERQNFILNFNGRSYSELSKGFNSNTLRNVKKAEKNHLNINFYCNPDDFISFIFRHKRFETSAKFNEILTSVVRESVHNGYGTLCCCTDSDGNMLSVALFVRHNNRHYYLTSATSSEGYKQSALFHIFASYMKSLPCNSIIDFEGSMIPDIARFFKGWGAVNEPFYFVHGGVWR